MHLFVYNYSVIVLCHVGIFMRGFHVPLDEIETHLNTIDGEGGLELEHVIAMKRCVLCVCVHASVCTVYVCVRAHVCVCTK